MGSNTEAFSSFFGFPTGTDGIEYKTHKTDLYI
jgi:hypothetical protein